jgi:hypothetical protein
MGGSVAPAQTAGSVNPRLITGKCFDIFKARTRYARNQMKKELSDECEFVDCHHHTFSGNAFVDL